MTTHEVLVKARPLIEKAWVPKAAYGPDYCVMGAISVAGGGHAARAELLAATGQSGIRLPGWNDSHTHAEVLALFDRAIAATAPTPDMSWLEGPAAECVPS